MDPSKSISMKVFGDKCLIFRWMLSPNIVYIDALLESSRVTLAPPGNQRLAGTVAPPWYITSQPPGPATLLCSPQRQQQPP